MVAEGSRGEVLLPHVIAEHYGARVGVIEDGIAWMGGRPAVGAGTVSEDPGGAADRTSPARHGARQSGARPHRRGQGQVVGGDGRDVRAVSAGWRIAVVQFVKSGKWRSGEEAAGRSLGVDCGSLGDGFAWDSKDMDRSGRSRARRGARPRS